MMITSEDGLSTFELVSCGAEWSSYPSICFRAVALSPEVKGSVSHAWFSLPDCEQFLRDLSALHAGTVEQAGLDSLSPDECVFEVFSLNERGHLGVRFVMSGMRHAESTVFPFKLSAGFQLDSTALPGMAAALAAELARQKTSS